ncbi:hypothetical protein [Streptomyces sp. ME19-01-6]|uniref:hypothetical protein n=1 Tax=Streptomyces sp. ME19-01-6 TaxID=3028686 RepID=UPI0029B649D3|nr:hypothetical protein [Streptomyces sp. ME19-01-6]MDX3232511.1 hypothetical protein [Streptomyces sp. ME19-01-6]
MTNARPTTTDRLALFGALTAVFGEMHPTFDNWAQRDFDATHKGTYGDHLVYRDGTKVADDTDRAGEPTMTASSFGRRCAARHVASYTAGQLASAVAITRALGYRVPARALLTGAAINAATHLIIDRRKPLLWLADKLGKTSYVEHCTVVRKPGGDAEISGPGSALMELDQALHRAIGVGAALTTTVLATRHRRPH